MNKDTVVTYESGGHRIVLHSAYGSALWVTEITGASSNSVAISETQGAAQVGSTISSQSVQPKDITVNGAVLKELEKNRRAILACIAPGNTGRLTIRQSGEGWYIEGAPKTTPVFSDSSKVQSFQFVLHCPYPYFKSTDGGNSQIAGLTRLFRFPCLLAGRWYISKYTESFFTPVENTGTVPLEFEVTFAAVTAVTNPEIYHVEKRTFIRIRKVLEAGESITVSTIYGRKGATLRQADGTESNAFRFLDIDSDLNMQMDPGRNTIRSDAEHNREGLRVQVVLPKGGLPGI